MPVALPIPNCGGVWIVSCNPSCGSTSSSGGGGGGGSTDCDCPSETVNVNVVADMAATVPYTGLKQFNVRGWMSIGDGSGGIWAYFPASSEAADGYFVVQPNSGSGRYIKT